MRATEKDLMINTYKKQFNYYLLSGEQSEQEYQLLQGQKVMMKLFFTDKEINRIENEMRVTKEYQREYFENIESWLKQIEREVGEKEILFPWTMEGVMKVYNHYDWLFNEYEGFKLALTNTIGLLERYAA